MPIVEICVGPHLAGKTYYATGKVSAFEGWARVSAEDLSKIFFPNGTRRYPKEDCREIIKASVISMVLQLTDRNYNVVIDDCNLDYKILDEYINTFGVTNKVVVKQINEPVNVLRARNNRKQEKGLLAYPDSLLLRQAMEMSDLQKLINYPIINSSQDEYNYEYFGSI